jgi:cell division protein FtsQ
MKFLNLKWLFFSALFIATIWAGWGALKEQGADLLPIKYVKIKSAYQYVAKEKIKQVLLEQVMTGFLNTDIETIRIELLDLPWVSGVNVQRIWPDTLDVKVYEQYPMARWGETGLLNEQSKLFRPDNIEAFKHLPQLIGPDGMEEKLMTIMKHLQKTLTLHSLVLQTFEVDKRRAWHLTLNNGIVLTLGQKNPLKKFNRFLTTLPNLQKKQKRTIARVDLRYVNGYTITWK